MNSIPKEKNKHVKKGFQPFIYNSVDSFFFVVVDGRRNVGEEPVSLWNKP
jgi:hypothetical protein